MSTEITLDSYDWAILAALQADGRLSNTDLAARVGLSAAPCWRRVRALEAAGFIEGYRAIINRRKIGLGVMAFVRVDAERNTAATTKELEANICALNEVISCHYISGSGTFELQVITRDLDTYAQFTRDLMNLPNVKDIHTSFSLGEVKGSGQLPLASAKAA
jgi:Lrp/AsnC family transcriptional regulator, leucine-responsive regulatory protein